MLALHLPDYPANAAEEKPLKAATETQLSKIDRQI